MKKIFLSILVTCAACGVMAQSITSYYMPGVAERTNLNVAFAPERGYFAIPIVGGLSLNTNGNLSIGSLVYENGGDMVTIMDSSVSADDALGKLSEGANFMGVSSRFDILNFGRYASNQLDFWSVNVSLRTSVNCSLPYEFFEFVKSGEANNISGININTEGFADIGFGYSKVIDDKLTVGGRVKLLVGLTSAKMSIPKFDVKMDAEEWSVDMVGELDVYGSASDAAIGEEFDLDDINIVGISPSGLGVAVDLGAEYAFSDRLRFAIAANDVGFIRWSEKSGVSAAMSATQSFSGIDIDGSGNASTPDFDFDDMVFKTVESKATTRFMQANINAGAEYSLFNELVSVGAIYTAQFWDSKTMHNIVATANVKPLSWITVATSYAFVNDSSLGLAVNFTPSWFNFYIATDFLFSKKSVQYIPINQTNMSVSLGLAVPFGKSSHRN